MELNEKYDKEKILEKILNKLKLIEKNDKNLYSKLNNIVDDEISKMITNNWRRRDAYFIINSLIKCNLQDEIKVYLWDLETAITGYCASDCIYRFSDDIPNLNSEELRKYVLSDKWR